MKSSLQTAFLRWNAASIVPVSDGTRIFAGNASIDCASEGSTRCIGARHSMNHRFCDAQGSTADRTAVGLGPEFWNGWSLFSSNSSIAASFLNFFRRRLPRSSSSCGFGPRRIFGRLRSGCVAPCPEAKPVGEYPNRHTREGMPNASGGLCHEVERETDADDGERQGYEQDPAGCPLGGRSLSGFGRCLFRGHCRRPLCSVMALALPADTCGASEDTGSAQTDTTSA